ncbi:F-box protein FBW2-like [Phragmites australis]|uniref:F-box protein FBW2-like n=1 Tax=Phragmites australis TaxID=29695 RepID=UPI002D79BB17|nr:F-box protein FBW2-like [Phragmites australis]
MKRRNPKSWGRFGGGGGQGCEAKMAKPDGGWRGRAPVVRWSHAEAMKKKPTGGGDAAVAGDGGRPSRELLGPEKVGLGGPSCGSRGFGMSWWEAAASTNRTITGGGEDESAWVWTEPVEKKSRPCGAGGREPGSDEDVVYEWRWTEAVSPEILALVLRGRVSADEVARGAARVCRAWREAAASPDVWGDVNIEAWCRRVNCRARADAAVRRLVARAQGTLRRLSAYRVGDAALAYVAASGKVLNVLQIPMSEITDHAVEKHAECLPALRVLDISNCLKITSKGIEALGRQCKLLLQLKRNMPPPEPPQGFNTAAKVVEEEALAVANTMPMLEQLELAYGLFSDLALDAILTKCRLLRTLDILGCWNVRLEGDIEEKCCALESFREPWEPEYSTDYSNSGGDCGDNDSDSDD